MMGESYTSSGCRPLRITWRLGTPVVVPAAPIHADALLSWARVDEARFAGDSLDPTSAQHDLPIERYECEQGWCFKASWLTFDWLGQPRQLHLSRRSDVTELAEAYADGRGVISGRRPWWSAASGPTKGYSILMQERLARHAVAYVVGEPQRVGELAERVEQIGKLARLGKGHVLAVTVEEVVADVCNWNLRNLPAPLGNEPGARAPGCLAAPYWQQPQEVFVPFA